MSTKRRAVAIVRVSQVAGREGESFVSPDQQRSRVEAECKRLGLRLGDVHDEMDVSGGTPLDRRRGLRAAVEAIEDGRAEVLVAAYFDRLFRSLATQTEVIRRVEQAGGQVLAVDFGRITEGTAAEWLNATQHGTMSEYMRRVTAERTGDAVRRAVERGVVPWSAIPPGYVRGEDGVLVKTDEAPYVDEAFQLRAEGATIMECRTSLATHGIERTWRGTQTMLRSKLYLGEIHFGSLVNLRAHEPIVDVDVWRRAQRTEIRGPKGQSNRLLARLGVLRCSGCGRRMSVGSSQKEGRRYYFYRCSRSAGDCSRRAAISAPMAEGVVVAHVRAALADVQGRASAEQSARDAERELARTQKAFDNAIRAFADLTGEPAARETLDALREARDAAQERVDQAGGGASLTLSIGSDWDRLTTDEQRALIRATVERAEVAPGKGAGRVSVQLFV